MNTDSFNQQLRHSELDTFDAQGAFTRIRHITYKHKFIVFLSCLICLSLVWAYKDLFPPIYKAKVLVQAEIENDKVREQFYSAWNTFRKSELSSEKVLMTSGPVILRVVEQLDLKYDDVYHTPLSHILYLWEKSTVGNYYREIKQSIFPLEKSPFAPTMEEIELSKTLKGFKDGAMLEPVPDTHVGYLVVKGPTYRVSEYANLLIDTYADYRRESYAKEAEIAFASLSKEVTRAVSERNIIMVEKLSFEKKYGLAMGLSKDKAILENWARLDQTIQETKFKLDSLEAGILIVVKQLSKESPYIHKADSEGRNPIRDQILDSLFNLQKELNNVQLTYQPGSPEIKNIKKRISVLKSSLPAEPKFVGSSSGNERSAHYEQLRARKQEIETDLASTRAELDRMKITQKKINSRIVIIPDLEKQYLIFQRDQEIALIKVRTLREKLMQADISRITALSAPPTLKVIEYASPPDKPYWPNTKLLFIVALILGFSGGVGLAIIIETMDNRATQSNLLPRTDLPIYAIVEITHRSRGLQRLSYKSNSKSNSRPQNVILAMERLKDIKELS